MKLMKFLKSSAGRKFYNFAYCWGACLVILGAVFKIAHMPFDSVLLMVGLFTEVFIFFISGFDTPDEPYRWEKIFPELKNGGKGKDYGDILEQAGKQYMEGVKAMEDRINSLNSVYKEQEARMKAVSETLDPGLIAEMRAETVEMTKLLKKLNEKYSQMLEAMTSKQ